MYGKWFHICSFKVYFFKNQKQSTVFYKIDVQEHKTGNFLNWIKWLNKSQSTHLLINKNLMHELHSQLISFTVTLWIRITSFTNRDYIRDIDCDTWTERWK